MPSVGRLVPVLYFFIPPAIGLLAAMFQRGKQTMAVLLAVLAALTGLGGCLWADAFFLSDTVRSDASVWIVDNLPVGTSIGLLHSRPYWDTPDIINMDYYHPDLTGGLYHHALCERDPDTFAKDLPEYIVITPRQRYGVEIPECWAWATDYEEVTTFRPRVPISEFSFAFQIHSATEVEVLRLRSDK
jgi:hypothetical protein